MAGTRTARDLTISNGYEHLAPAVPRSDRTCGSVEVACGFLEDRNLSRAIQLVVERFGAAAAQMLPSHYKSYPQLCMCCQVGDELAGICFGYPDGREGGGAILEGLAVTHDQAGRGLGSRLLAHFEQAAREAGYKRITLATADEYAEHFYLRHGYRQTEYVVVLASESGDVHLDDLPVSRMQYREDGSVAINITSEGYSPIEKRRLADNLGAPCIYCTFVKELG